MNPGMSRNHFRFSTSLSDSEKRYTRWGITQYMLNNMRVLLFGSHENLIFPARQNIEDLLPNRSEWDKKSQKFRTKVCIKT